MEQLKFILKILLINQWHHRKSESQKTHVTLFMSKKKKKNEKEVFNEKKISKIMFAKKRKTNA